MTGRPDSRAFAVSYFDRIRRLIDTVDLEAVVAATTVLEQAWRNRQQVFVIGNGGSASTASHWACDLNKGTSHPGRPRMRVISLTDNMAHFSAIANDCGYDKVFTEQLTNLLQAGDVLIGISASGNSPNVLDAFRYARDLGATTIAVVGFTGGQLAKLADRVVHFQSSEYGPVEDMQLMLNHLITDWFRAVVIRSDGDPPPAGSGG